MRRGLFIVLAAGLLAIPAPVAAATPPQPTIVTSNVHWEARGVLSVDVAWTCAPAPRGAEWEPVLYLFLQQGRRERAPWGAAELWLGRSSCDGARHARTFEVTSESRPFHGSRVFVYAAIDTSWYVASSDTYVDLYAENEPGFMRIRRH